MRILLAQNSLYYPSFGGGDKSNRLLVEALAAHGHTCRAVARVSKLSDASEREQLLRCLAARSVLVQSGDSGVVTFQHNGVLVNTVTDHPNLRDYFAETISAFEPDVILTSTDDPAQLMLKVALQAASARVVYLVRTTLAVPFGPDCAFPSPEKTDVLRQTDAVVGVSRYVADYVRRYSGIDAVALPISLLEAGPYPRLGRFENEFVTMINPCAVKGIDIFLALAREFPEARFAAVPTWGTSDEDRTRLQAMANVTILDPVENIDVLLGRTRILLVPSLWAEARSRIVVEAMLRGVPVLASDIGGIPEANLGVGCLLPVRPIQKYQPRLDQQMVPVAEVPVQALTPWRSALARVISDRRHYEELAHASHEAAMNYAAGLSVRPFEELLETVTARPRAQREPVHPGKMLTPDRQRLLAVRLRKAASSAFPSVPAAAPDKLRLFCFPHAGGGAAAFRDWAGSLPDVALCPVRLRETPLHGMDAVVSDLTTAIRPHLSLPFAFFGHSMGAAVAFELARALRRKNLPQPLCLVVSGARAPQFRLGHIPGPEPSEEQLIQELRTLGGLPEAVLADRELLDTILPALRADAALYRNYIYPAEPPLSIPIYAYGGLRDPNVSQAHLEAWREQTTGQFSLRLFEGGHFFLLENRDPFLASLADDLGHESEWALSAALSTLWKAGKRDTVFKLLRAFLDSVALQIKTLRGADRDVLWETAHTLAGSCREYGAIAMGQTASTLQALTETGDLSDAGLLIDTLKQQFVRVMHAVADFSKNSD